MTTAEIHSRTSSRQSQLETSRSDTMSTDNFFIDSYHSHDSANTFRSGDMNFSKSTYDNSSSMNSQDNLMVSRRASRTLQTEPIFIGRNELEQMRVPRSGQNVYEFESHSLPRRTCIHHINEEYHSLPRRDHHHHYLHDHNDVKMSNGTIPELMMAADSNRRLSASHQDAQYVNVVPDTYSLSRRSSAHLQQVPSLSINLQSHHYQQHTPQQQHQPVVPPSEEMCSTCSSETETSSEEDEESESGSETDEYEEGEEKEIFIDFKPRLSPTRGHVCDSTPKKKKKLLKAMSEGEILLEDNGTGKQLPIHSASEEDLAQTPTDYSSKHLDYADTPIRDENIFKADNFLNVSPDASTTSNRYSRETFRKRSVSLEDPLADAEKIKKSNRHLKPNGSSPGSPGAADEGKSSLASSEDVTRDHSDGNWNESQATVLPTPPRWVAQFTVQGNCKSNKSNELSYSISPPDFNSLMTPKTKRKHLLHQQRSSLDIDAIDVEDMADQVRRQSLINHKKTENLIVIQIDSITSSQQFHDGLGACLICVRMWTERKVIRRCWSR